MADRQAVWDHLDEVVAAAALLPDDERVRMLDAAVSRLQAEQATALRELEQRGGLQGSGCRSRGAWARLHLRRQHSAWRLTQRSRWLPSLPGFAAAFGAGRVSDEHVDVLIKWIGACGLEPIQASEQTLLDLAGAAGPKELEQALEQLADLVNADRDAAKVTALGQRSITIRRVGDLVHVDAMVEPALGEALKTAVEADAQLPPGIRPADDSHTRAQRRADAFGQIVLRGIDTHPNHTRRRLRASVSITVSLDFLLGLDGAPRPLLEHFGAIPAPTAHRLICDGDLTRVVLDAATGLPLDLGRASRLAKRRQRHALKVIFRTCAFPGCTVPFRFCEIHHLHWWSRGGDTDLALLAPYCWTHHHFLHEGGFTVNRHTGTDGSRLIHRRPDGNEIPDPDQPLQHTVAQLKLDHPPPSTASPPTHVHAHQRHVEVIRTADNHGPPDAMRLVPEPCGPRSG
jgi:hypothetical protein